MIDRYWQEEESSALCARDVVDLAFPIGCQSLPIDHAWSLSQAIREKISWWDTEPLVGLHLIYGGASGNGWQRPETGDATFYLTRRARLILRLPKTRTDDARSALQGQILSIFNFSLKIGEAVERSLNPHPALYARHVLATPSEDVFLATAAQELQRLGVSFKKMLAGKESILMTPKGPYLTRSLFVADLRPTDSIELQRRGIGAQRILGCGLFVPHKTISAD